MIKCPFCQITYVDNILFCSECGTYLPESEVKRTDPVGIEFSDWQDLPTGDPELGVLSQPGVDILAVQLIIGGGMRTVEAPLHKPIELGRLDPAADVFPDVDFSGDDSVAHGISRRHARITKLEKGVVIEDLGSVNGTFVNSRRLAPYLPETLKNGDNIQLGRLEIVIKMVEGH
jgi:pSer/pThr/pTyr-binding forkhead associated (FHA) protein